MRGDVTRIYKRTGNTEENLNRVTKRRRKSESLWDRYVLVSLCLENLNATFQGLGCDLALFLKVIDDSLNQIVFESCSQGHASNRQNVVTPIVHHFIRTGARISWFNSLIFCRKNKRQVLVNVAVVLLLLD
ncbi:hypothetical protein F2P81_014419 [Scophthalmus maximus]|uniref:Uncharacterized protein n=1 Tax=Scophthalmus maximus TaxID=52904 RepID=A0A6A4SJP3_SCOMX|nr:hypothetical protein F2P81_014419 [Scophthalmus maximus]